MTTTSDKVATTGTASVFNILVHLNLSLIQQRTMWAMTEPLSKTFIEVEMDFAKEQIGIFVADSHGNVAGIHTEKNETGLNTMLVGVGTRDEEQHQESTSWLMDATQDVNVSDVLAHSYYEEMKSGESNTEPWGDVDCVLLSRLHVSDKGAVEPWGVMNTPKLKVEDESDRVIYQQFKLSQMLAHYIPDFPTERFEEVFGDWMVYIMASEETSLIYEIRFENQHGQVAGYSGYAYGRGTGLDIHSLQVACGMKVREGEKESLFLTGASEKTTQMMTQMKFTEEQISTPHDSALIPLNAT